jgi:hypothetical protein
VIEEAGEDEFFKILGRFAERGNALSHFHETVGPDAVVLQIGDQLSRVPGIEADLFHAVEFERLGDRGLDVGLVDIVAGRRF